MNLFGSDGFKLCCVWVCRFAVSKIDLGRHQNVRNIGHIVVHLRVPLRIIINVNVNINIIGVQKEKRTL